MEKMNSPRCGMKDTVNEPAISSGKTSKYVHEGKLVYCVEYK